MENKITIAYCTPSLYISGGVEKVLTLKANYLCDKLGYDVHIIITDGGDKEPYFPLSKSVHLHQLNINYDHLYNASLPKRVVQYFIKNHQLKTKLTQCLFSIKPDISISLLRRDINFLCKIKDGSIKLGELHSNRSNYRDFSDSPLPEFVKKIVKFFWNKQLINQLKQLRKFIVLTYENKDAWKELDNVCVIHNPLPFIPDNYSNCKTKQAIAVGRFSPEKGYDLLIPAWNIVSKKHPDWTLRIYGEGDVLRNEYQKTIDSLGLTDNCILEHSVPNIFDKYCESSILVLSSRFEGFGMVIIEAMSCGVPPISFACPCGPKDIISNNVDGLLVENGNIEKLADAICYLIENEDIRINFGKIARKNIERFKIDGIMSQWDCLFKEVLNRNN